jgi:predicted nuclease with TOPRIM domain
MTDWQRDLEDARATIEELTRERDEARAEAKREQARANRLQDLLDTPPDTER